jgi:hypothetical protein
MAHGAEWHCTADTLSKGRSNTYTVAAFPQSPPGLPESLVMRSTQQQPAPARTLLISCRLQLVWISHTPWKVAWKDRADAPESFEPEGNMEL